MFEIFKDERFIYFCFLLVLIILALLQINLFFTNYGESYHLLKFGINRFMPAIIFGVIFFIFGFRYFIKNNNIK